MELPLGLFGAALGLAALPGLAGHAEKGGYESFGLHLGRSIRLTAFFSLPATAGLFVLARPLCGLLFGHGAYAGDGIALTAAVLSGSCLGLPALCASRPLLSAAGALGEDGAAFRAAVAGLAPLAALGGGLIVFGNAEGKAAFCLGLGLAAAWCNAALLLRLLKARGVAQGQFLPGHGFL